MRVGWERGEVQGCAVGWGKKAWQGLLVRDGEERLEVNHCRHRQTIRGCQSLVKGNSLGARKRSHAAPSQSGQGSTPPSGHPLFYSC